METWSTPLFSDDSYGEDFRTFKKQRGPQNETLPVPRQLPPPAEPSKIPTDLKIHTVSLDAFLETLREADAALLAPEVPFLHPFTLQHQRSQKRYTDTLVLSLRGHT